MKNKYKNNTIVSSKKVDSIIDKSEKQFNKYKQLYPTGFNIEYHTAHTVDLGGNGTIYNIQFEVTTSIKDNDIGWTETTTIAYIFWYPLSPNRKCPYTVKTIGSDNPHKGYTKIRHFKQIKDVIDYTIKLSEKANNNE